MRYLLILLYVLVLLSPLGIVIAKHEPTDHGFVFTLGAQAALVGYVALALQFVISARLAFIERYFGMDALFRFHKAVAFIALTLLLAHPLLLAADSGDWGLIWDGARSGHLWFGRIAIALLWIHIMLSSVRAVLRMDYETWRWIHDVGSIGVLGFGFLHSYSMGADIQPPLLHSLWFVILAVALVAFIWHRIVRPWTLPRYRVRDVRQETADVWTVTLEPPPGHRVPAYAPGQFCFVTFERALPLPVEEHHWTISSSPTQPDMLMLTIKEAGDFTLSIGKTRPDDTARVLGPYGRFSYVHHPDEDELVFLAAGIGITPFLAMLRHLRDTKPGIKVQLIYVSRSERDIICRDELNELVRTQPFPFQIVHAVSGERGRIAAEEIVEHCGGVESKAFYVCGPPAFIDGMIGSLRRAKVPSHRIHFERFAL